MLTTIAIIIIVSANGLVMPVSAWILFTIAIAFNVFSAIVNIAKEVAGRNE